MSLEGLFPYVVRLGSMLDGCQRTTPVAGFEDEHEKLLCYLHFGYEQGREILILNRRVRITTIDC